MKNSKYHTSSLTSYLLVLLSVILIASRAFAQQAVTAPPPTGPATPSAARADAQGNAHLWGNLGLTFEAAYAARRTIITCEEIVPDDIIRSDPNRTVIPGFLTTAVVEEPGGALPSSVQGYWRRDFEPFLDYHRCSRTTDGFETWLREWVLDLPDRAAYLQHMGEAAVERLRVRDEHLAASANFAP